MTPLIPGSVRNPCVLLWNGSSRGEGAEAGVVVLCGAGSLRPSSLVTKPRETLVTMLMVMMIHGFVKVGKL
jgi:hypothetical protein